MTPPILRDRGRAVRSKGAGTTWRPFGGCEMPGEYGSQHWRDRAKEARTKADQTKEDRRSKRRMLGIADFYESLAERIEQHAWKQRRGATRIQK